jgi:hypothetical protein
LKRYGKTPYFGNAAVSIGVFEGGPLNPALYDGAWFDCGAVMCLHEGSPMDVSAPAAQTLPPGRLK